MMFFNNKFSGIDFRENKLTFASIKMEKGLPVLQQLLVSDLEQPLIQGGRVSEQANIQSVLRDYVKGKGGAKQAHLAIPTQHTLVRKISSLPDLEEKELGRLLQFQIGDSILLPFDNPIYDFVKIGSLAAQRKLDNDDTLSVDDLSSNIQEELLGARSEILFFATSRELTEDLIKVCEQGEVKPLSAEIRALALKRLINFVHSSWLTQTEMVVEVSKESIDLHIFKDELILFSRTMPINQNVYFDTLQNESAVEKSDETLWIEDEMNELILNETKENQAHQAAEEIAAVQTANMEEAFQLNAYVSDLVNEVEKAQNFFRYSLGERQSEFTRIIVTGEYTSRIFDLFSSQMPTHVCRIDYEAVLNQGFAQEQLLDTCSVAIGLAMRGHEKAKKR
ncbi:type IV pilus biogenesis protein PilM [Halalkalibacter urbisdiaboli]|uniref:type IV pilus biogenesis protein PilM n=1 Tax=Halalkalibacter urbisdiaboli TaxID=1960589 RepID=UPI0010567889|nr:pilus assembly protein PilM [Halalkalibacter urbisdiaboli]